MLKKKHVFGEEVLFSAISVTIEAVRTRLE
jgi:hypothetical protein